MKFFRWLAVMFCLIGMGYLGFLALFADGSALSLIVVMLIFIALGAGVGWLVPRMWYVAGLGSWGALVLVIPELTFRLGRAPIEGAQPLEQVVLTAVIVIMLALASGYIGLRLKNRRLAQQ